MTYALAAFEPAPQLSEPLRQAYAAAAPADLVPAFSAPATVAAATGAPPKPKAAAKPAGPEELCVAQRRADRRHQGTAEAFARPGILLAGVEKALRAIARKIHSTKQADPAAGMPPIDPESEEVQQLKSAAMPLLFQLREDQKKRSPLARPHHRAGTRRLHDLSRAVA